MYPNSDSFVEMTPQTQEPTVSIPPQSKKQDRLEKGIAYFSSKMFLIQLIIIVVVSGFEISYGTKYYHQCPVSPNIPLFLLVHGSTKLGWVACGIIAYIEAKFFSNSSHIRILMLMNLIIQLVFLVFFITWFIIGNVWVWSVKGKVQTINPTVSSTYCDDKLYSAAQGLIISTYIIFAVIAVITIKRRVISKKLHKAAPVK
jgi:hypothetical protein